MCQYVESASPSASVFNQRHDCCCAFSSVSPLLVRLGFVATCRKIQLVLVVESMPETNRQQQKQRVKLSLRGKLILQSIYNSLVYSSRKRFSSALLSPKFDAQNSSQSSYCLIQLLATSVRKREPEKRALISYVGRKYLPWSQQNAFFHQKLHQSR